MSCSCSSNQSPQIRSLSLFQQGHAESGGRDKVTATPWREIFTSPPVWGVIAGHVASNWGVYQLNSLLPTYLNDVLK